MNEIKVAAGLDQILAQRNAIVDKLSKIGELMDETEALLESSDFCVGGSAPTSVMWLYGQFDRLALKPHSETRHRFAASSIRGLDFLAWRHLFKVVGYERFLDAKGRDELNKQLYGGEFEPLTEATARSTFSALYENKDTVLKEGVVRMFQHLSRDYKTNTPRMFGPKLVVKNVCHLSYTGRIEEGGQTGRRGEELDDLLRFMNLMDGRSDDQVFRFWLSSELLLSQSGAYEHDFFQVKCFKNGNAHLTFKRMDLVEKLNRILAEAYPNALPA